VTDVDEELLDPRAERLAQRVAGGLVAHGADAHPAFDRPGPRTATID
jgi:hypothetical protein